MREVHSNALMSDKNINLKDMHSDTEKKKLVDKAKKSNTEYEPADYLTELIKMEDLGEKIWIKKERLFSHNVKVDQIPGPDSMHTMKAKYDRKSHAIELANRYANRMMSNGISPDKIQINKMIKEMDAVLKQGTKDIKNQTEKINKSLDIIESITKILNGDC
jgi:aminopeptidase N